MTPKVKKIALIVVGLLTVICLILLALNWQFVRLFQAAFIAAAAADAQQRREYAEAEKLDREAMEICQPLPSSLYRVLIVALSGCYFEEGHKQEAEDLLKKALNEKNPPNERNDLIRLEDAEITNEGLIRLYLAEKRYAEAEPIARACLAQEEREPFKSGCIKPLHYLGISLSGQGKQEEAKPFFKQSLSIQSGYEPENEQMDKCILAACLNSFDETGKASKSSEADDLAEQSLVMKYKKKPAVGRELCQKALQLYKTAKDRNEVTEARELICLSNYLSCCEGESKEEKAEHAKVETQRTALREKLFKFIGVTTSNSSSQAPAQSGESSEAEMQHDPKQ